MNLSQYLSEERGRQAALAKSIKAHTPDLSKWASGGRPIPLRFAVPIETHTGGLVTRQEMFPDHWQTYWPELIGKPSAIHPSTPDKCSVLEVNPT